MLPNQNSKLAGSIVAKHLPGRHDQSSHGRGNPNYPRVKDEVIPKDANPEAAAAAIELRSEYAKLDTPRTDMLSGIAEARGGKMNDLEYRLKSSESLARKIESNSKKKGTTIAEETDNIWDVSRYTMEYPTATFSENANGTLRDLEAEGFTIYEVKNTMGSRDVDYRGVNVKLEKDGQKMELQFHTPESTAAKKANHPIYEVRRADNTPESQYAALDAQMVANSNMVPAPPGVDSIG
jgi:hypothetical protein